MTTSMTATTCGVGLLGAIASVALLLVCVGFMGCAVRTGDGAVCAAIGMAIVHQDTPASRAIVREYLGN